MTHDQHVELLKIIWGLDRQREYRAISGETVRIRQFGKYDDATGHFSGVEIVLDGVVCIGEAVMSAGNVPANETYDNLILQVAPYPSACLLKDDGTPLPQIILKADPVVAAVYETLRKGPAPENCSGHIAAMENLGRISMFTRLLANRLQRKCNDLHKIYEKCDSDWNETMYIMLMRTMGDSKNKDVFTELAQRVRYRMVARERNSIQYVEALLLGTSGLLEMYDDDIYVKELRSDYEYLRRKYSLTPIRPGSWVISQTNPYNHPVLRIAQLSAFLSTREFLFENMIRCQSVEDIQLFFRAEASQYWSTHYIPGKRSGNRLKRIGEMKANLLGINLVVPVIFAYGDYVKNDALKERAIDLLEKTECESNSILEGWKNGGVIMENAFDSQAMLQLNNEYCRKGICWKCPVGKRVIKKYCGVNVTA